MREVSYGDVRSLPDEFEVLSWNDHGHESFGQHVGEFWFPTHIRLNDDFESFESLQKLSRWLDERDFRVHEKATDVKSGVVVTPS